MDRAEVSRRLKAGRALRGVKVTELANHDVLQRSRITANLIGETERQERDAREMELRAIADALDLPHSFMLGPDPFASAPTEDGATLAGNAEKLDQLTGEISELRRTVREEADELLTMRGEVLGRIYERISQIDGRLKSIDDRLELLERPTLEELTRRTKQQLVGPGADADGSTEAGSGTREPAEASPEAPPVRVRGTRRNG